MKIHLSSFAKVAGCCAAAVSLALQGATAAQALSAEKQPLHLTNMSTINASTGFVKMTAEIHNQSDRWACLPTVILRLRDAADQDLKISSLSTASAGGAFEDRVIASRQWLPPGESTPLMYMRDPKNISGKPSKVAARATARDCRGEPAKVKVENFATEVTNKGWAKATGTIVVENGNCRAASAVIAIYAADGTIDAAYTVNPTPMEQVAKGGERIDFTRTSIPFTTETPKIKVWADCSAM